MTNIDDLMGNIGTDKTEPTKTQTTQQPIEGNPFAKIFAEVKRGNNLPDGEYLTKIDKFELDTVNGKPIVRVTYLVIDGTQANRKQSETLWLMKKDGDWNTMAFNTFNTLYTTSFGKDTAIDAQTYFASKWKQFEDGGRKIVTMDEFLDVQGNLKLVSNQRPDSEYVNFTFTFTKNS